ncbi:MAG: MraZ protein [Flavobacteriales bacterium]|jgi:MraZ protein
MLNLLGEYGCKVDAKGRLMFPAKLRKQMEEIIHQGLVLNRDIFEKCLVLYPKPEWEKVNAEMSRLSRYNRKHQVFQRKFMKGATMMELDGTGRLLIPSSLLEYAGISADKNEIIITGMLEKIEIWNKDAYNALVLEEDEDFGDLAEEIRREIEGPKMPPIN